MFTKLALLASFFSIACSLAVEPRAVSWQAVGCAADGNPRALSAYSVSSNTLTPKSCIAACSAAGYSIAGVEYSTECYCANAFTAGYGQVVDASQCTAPCSGDSKQICGGTWRLSVYKSSSATTSTTSSTTASTASSTMAASTTSVTTTSASSSTPSATSTSSKLVVAHFIVGNTYPYTQSDWYNDIKLAASKGIDAFALNVGSDSWEPARVADAFAAAISFGSTFKLFFSFDVTSLACSTQDNAAFLRNYINTYAGNSAYLIYRGRALVSTFSGENCNFGQSTVDAGWASVVRSGVPSVWFVPAVFVDPATLGSYSSFNGVFNWDGSWPKSAISENFNLDTSFLNGNTGRIYMAAASPWFYAHYSFKNWFYGGDNWLVAARWEDLIAHRSQVDIVQIISWNDYGESHYVGPIEGAQPNSQAWVNGFDHTAWLDMIKIYAQAFKTGSAPTFSNDQLFIWSRPHPAAANATDTLGKPTGWNWTSDELWAMVFSTAASSVTLTAGSNSQTFSVAAGISKLKVPSSPGSIKAILSRNNQPIVSVAPTGFNFTSSPSSYNYNAFVASGST